MKSRISTSDQAPRGATWISQVYDSRSISYLHDLRVTGQTVGSKENPFANGWRSDGNRKPA